MWDGPLQLHVHGTYVVKNCKLVLDINRSCHRDLRNDQNGYLYLSMLQRFKVSTDIKKSGMSLWEKGQDDAQK